MPRVCRYARPVEPLAQRLAERTLELVDIPSESLHEAEVRAHLLSLVPEAFAPEYAAEDAFVFARPGGRTCRSFCSSATTTPCPRRTTSRAESPTARCTAAARPT